MLNLKVIQPTRLSLFLPRIPLDESFRYIMSTEIKRSQENYTILRIKRKRNEEPLDALGETTALRTWSIFSDGYLFGSIHRSH